MFIQTLYFWFLLFLYLIPILIIGILILRKTCSINRLELLIPAGSIFGTALFIFLINIIAFLFKGSLGINLAYLLLIIIGLFLNSLRLKSSDIDLPPPKILIFYISSFLIWVIFVFWKGNFALIGSDTNLYYSVAHTFIKGNFPPFTPWQPGLPLNYHLGVFLLIGAFYSFTHLSFRFLHIFFSSLFIFLSAQIIIWIWCRHKNIASFLWGNLAAAIVLISFGFIKVIIPYFPFRLPLFSNINQLILWLRDLPTVNQSIEVYGAPINLDALIYFIFHAFGLALSLALIVVIIHPKKEKPNLSWIILLIGLASLALINESAFIVSAPALILCSLLVELQNKRLFKNLKLILCGLLVMVSIILVQGGAITTSIFSPSGLEKSVLIFPKKNNIKENFFSYHYYQEISKILPKKAEWASFNWYHTGLDVLILTAVILLIFSKFSYEQRIITIALFVSGLSAIAAYNFVVPKYLIANGNRFLAFAFINLSLSVILSLQNFLNYFLKNKLKYIIIFFLIIFIFLPTILPPLALLTKNRFGEDKLIPKKEEASEGISWMRDNLSFNTNVVVLDARAPHPSGMARSLVQAGVFAPLFPDDFRAYTIEASPEYFDIAYFLNPSALQKLKVSALLIDSSFFETLPWLRKDQLENNLYFRKFFDNSAREKNWEKVYGIADEYFKEGGEMEGSFKKLSEIMPKRGKFYIDDEQRFTPSFLKRALIFSLRDRDLYFNPGSGIYLNVEVDIPFTKPVANETYDYLILSKETDPQIICHCEPKLIWKGMSDSVYVWHIGI